MDPLPEKRRWRRQVKAAEDFPVRSGGSSADLDATRAGAVPVRRIRTLSSSGSSWDGVRADPGLKLMDSLPEKRRWRAFPRLPLIDDGLTGGADQARESSLADVEVSAQRFELHVIVLGNGGPGQWHWRGGRAASRQIRARCAALQSALADSPARRAGCAATRDARDGQLAGNPSTPSATTLASRCYFADVSHVGDGQKWKPRFSVHGP